jgi:hypothetical protein
MTALPAPGGVPRRDPQAMFTMMVFLWVKHTTMPNPLIPNACLWNMYGNVMQGFCTAEEELVMIAVNVGKVTMKKV